MRSFIAVDVASSATIGRLQSDIMSAQGWSARDVKPIEAHNFHFTLIFLGEIRDGDADSIKAKLSEVQFEPFTITYVDVGAFPKSDAARVMWVGVDSAGGQKLSALAGDVVSKMAGIGFQADKPFSPHITIFRAKGRPVRMADIASKYRGATFGIDTVDRVHLKKSDLTSSGPVYSNIYTVAAKK
jgi:RNA 2',3'-cyclic 3'-phosphodiesterase